MMTTPSIPVRIWTQSDLRALKWGSILFGVGVGLFLPRGLRRYGRFVAVGVTVLAIKPLMALLREDSLICNDRPGSPQLTAEIPTTPFNGVTPTSLEGAEAAD